LPTGIFSRRAGAADTRPALRIISLAPNLTEIVCALGLQARLVGRSSACDFPPEIGDRPVVAEFGRPNVEAVLALRPDLILATDMEKPALLQTFNAAGIECRLLPCEGWDQMLAAAHTIAQAAGQAEAGEKWAQDMNSRRAALAERSARWRAGQPPPRVYVEIWGDPITTANRQTFLNDLITLAGGANIAAALGPQYPHINAEWVVKENPDVILIAYMPPAPNAATLLRRRPGWSGSTAIQHGRVCSHISPDLLLRPGPRMIAGAEQFAQWLEANYKW